MMSNYSGSEVVAVLGVIAPAALAAQAHTSGWINAKNYENILVVVSAGVLGTAATIDAKIQQATASNGAGAKDVSGKAITQLTKAGDGDGKIALINLRQEELDVKNNFRFVQVTLTVGTASSAATVVILGLGSRYGPAYVNDAAAVVQIVD